ncbi:uncharacterized protein [Ranitomeya imitator]|uniref:uncharacterized protein isoform X2 n=1 Tax=Ranitomeya imitator TaxID=111125 RepID=UPI0037E967E4
MSAALEYDKDVHIRKFPPYPLIVSRDFIQGIKEELHNTIPTQETSPDPRALINNHLIQVIEEANQYDGPPNFNIKDVQDKIPIQETSPDRRAVIYNNYPLQGEKINHTGPSQHSTIVIIWEISELIFTFYFYKFVEEPNRYDGPPNFIFFWRNIKDKFSKIRDYIRMLKKKYIFAQNVQNSGIRGHI